MTFIRPVRVGDVLEVYTEVESIGRTSMKIHVEAWARRFQTHVQEKVTDATFTFVAIDETGKPRPIPPAWLKREFEAQWDRTGDRNVIFGRLTRTSQRGFHALVGCHRLSGHRPRDWGERLFPRRLL
jgi:acyl-CoA hydrolase